MTKILLAFDGSTNNARDFVAGADPDNSKTDFTNVLKLHLLAGGSIDNKRNDIEDQICLYKRGLGGESTNGFIKSFNNTAGIRSQQTVPMREMLEKVYKKGDELYMIGFSRGSSSAREFVVELEEKGLKTASGETVEMPPVKFLGCFDTVSMRVFKNIFSILWNSNFGLITKPSVLGEKNGKLSPIVDTAVHNVSMDDNRQGLPAFPMFPPVLMDSKDKRVHEVWFPGEHGDVGGTTYEKGLADGSLLYMKEWMEKCGFKFLEKGEDIKPENVKIDVEGFEDIVVDRKRMNIDPDPKTKTNWKDPEGQQKKNPSYRFVVDITNEEIIPDGTVRVHKSYLEHVEFDETGNEYYRLNDELLKCADVVVVGSLNTVLEDETKRMKALIAKKKAELSTSN